jgi:predicted phage terminase large subunit-like protein
MIENVKLTGDLVYGFSGSLLSSGFDEAAPTPECHREWWNLCCSTFKRVAIAAPRGHAKSTAITKAYLLAAALFRDRRHIVIVSDTYKQAVQFLGEAKRELEVNLSLRELFGVLDFETDREDEVVVRFTDGYDFRIVALGSEQKVRGIIWNNKRPDLIVGDDLENDEIVMNPDRREKFNKWLFNALLPAMSHKGVVRLVGTILHMDAALERLMPKDRSANTIHTELKSYMKRPTDGWMSVRYKAHNEDFSEILWPIKWNEKKFREIRQMFISQGNPEGYYQEYLNRPIDPSNTFFKKSDFIEFDQNDDERDWFYAPTYLAMDGAFSTKERRDWCALGIGSLDEHGLLYIRHVIRDRLDTKEVVDTILRLQERFKFTTCLIGKGAYEKGIGPFLRDSLSRIPGRFLNMETIPEVIDKRLRAQSIRGRMRTSGVKFQKKASWYPVFEQELLEFDRGKHDDQVDMMSLFGMYLDKLMIAPDRAEIKDLEYEEEFNMVTDLQVGQSTWTGY